VRVALNSGRRLPEGMLLDPDGKPTTDPSVMFRDHHGALLPFGRHKGYGLALVAELLAGGLSGAGTIQPDNPRRGGTVNNMTTFLVDPGRLAGTEWLRREVEGFVAYVKDSPPGDPEAPVLVPGDPERMARERLGREGITIDPTTWADLLAAGEKVGFSRDEAERLAT